MQVPHSTEFLKEFFIKQFPYLTAPMNRIIFFDIIRQRFPEHTPGYDLIWRAYAAAKDAFRDDFRDTGERTFEHPRRLALISVIHLNEQDPNIVAGNLLHDNVEDKPEWSIERVRGEFNKEVAMYVGEVTKLDKADFDGDGFARDLAMHARQEQMSEGGWRIKIPDVFDNVLTLVPPVTPEKREKKMVQVRTHYIHEARKHNILYWELLWIYELHRREPGFTGFRTYPEPQLPFNAKS